MNDQSSFEETILIEALALPVDARRAFVEGRCGANADTTDRVVALLRGYQENSAYLETPAPKAALQSAGHAFGPIPPEPKPGDRIGHYHLRQRIGEGGFGVVFLAEQEQPVQRLVALKVIRLGLDTREFIARFEAERQALAVMDHPNIARVFDAGATDSGRPYLVMELIRGIPITDYCDEHRLSVAARLELFLHVCGAIQHAHQKGVIHCDLKPSNVLIEFNDSPEAGCPKVIDFGIAKAAPDSRTDKTLFTRFHALIGTPAYTSPEQMDFSGLDIDTRSDIYSLGVLLYELLTGQQPFASDALENASLEEMRRLIRDVDPPRPSMRVGALSGDERLQVSRHRSIEPEKMAPLLRCDLDWIVMRCLEKDRSRRYETANALAMDLRRYLACEPVVARPPTRAYRFGKFARRNPTWMIAGAAISGALLVGLVLASVGFARARVQQRTAESARREAEDLVSFMIKDLQPELQHAGRLPLMAQVAERAVYYFSKLPPDLNSTSTERSRAIALETLAYVRSAAGDKESVASLWHEALAARRRAAAGSQQNPLLAIELARTEFVEVSQTHPLVASHAWGVGSPESDARLAVIVDQAREACRDHLNDPEISRAFAQVLVGQCGYLNSQMAYPEKALSVGREAEQLYRDLLALSPEDTALEGEFVRLLIAISIATQQTGDVAGGIKIAAEALALADRAREKNPANIGLRGNAAFAATQLAYRLIDFTMEPASAAESVARERWLELMRLDPQNFSYRYEFAKAHALEVEFLYASGRKVEARPVLEKYVELLTPVAKTPDDFLALESSEFKLAALTAQFGYRETAYEHLRLTPEWHRRYIASLSPATARQPDVILHYMEFQCIVLEILDDWPALELQARAMLATAVDASRVTPKSMELQRVTTVASYCLGRSLLRQGLAAKAIPVLQAAVSGVESLNGPQYPEMESQALTIMTVAPLAEALISVGDTQEAQILLEKNLAMGEPMVAANPNLWWDLRVVLAESGFLLATTLDSAAPKDAERRRALLDRAATILTSHPASSPLTVHESALLAKIEAQR